MKYSLAQKILDDVKVITDNTDFSGIVNKHMLITGGSGLIGTYLVATLKRLYKQSVKFKLTVVTHSPWPVYLKLLVDYPGARVYRGDLTDKRFIEKLPKADLVIHAAGYGQPSKFLENPLKTIQLNTTSTLELLNLLKANGRFLFISTSEVYSGLRSSSFTEDQIGTTNPYHPRACYIESKRTGEAICYASRQLGKDVKSIRLSLAYGPGTKKGDKRVLNSFIEKALNGKIELLDVGLAMRTYCYITDAVEIILKVLLIGQEHVYNVGGESRTSIKDLAKTIGNILKVPVIIPKSDQKIKGAPDDVRLDLSKIKKEFTKKDFVSLQEGLIKTIEWQKILYNK